MISKTGRGADRGAGEGGGGGPWRGLAQAVVTISNTVLSAFLALPRMGSSGGGGEEKITDF